MARPIKTFKLGAVRASIFENSINKNGKIIKLPKVVLEVRYKDPAGTWKSTHSLSLNELPKAILALQKAYEYLMQPKVDNVEDLPENPFKRRIP